MHDTKIFIVDDSPIQLILLEKVLQREGFAVEAYSNGPDLIEGISINKPDLIISDIHMPELNGFELIEEIRSFPKGEKIPCFLISSKADTVIRNKVDAIGADGFIKKPFEYQSLMAIIKDLLNESKRISHRAS
ncbi:response regulator [Fodinibius sp.]|uniref:response regulator n=1 Tax=Fodinibius sp. TaxID=1872440 RepID=UPI002ACE8408|nr:response regulator [Fodinibius sp.]MDZ7659829.1 response regulator [Fodinibius sp.]